VRRDGEGKVVIGRQYQDHNPTPGPVYAGGGYAPIISSIHKGQSAVKELLDKYPDLVNDITTGGASPLHCCGMGRSNQMVTEYIISRGGDM